jgi:hypothetical protein
VASFILGFFGGIVAWFATTFIAQPWREISTLRSEAIKALTRFDDQYYIDESGE